LQIGGITSSIAGSFFPGLPIASTAGFMRRLFFYTTAFFLLCGCNTPDVSPSETLPGDSVQSNSKAERLNNIHLFENGGMKVTKAFLTDESGHLLPGDNLVQAGKPVYLNIIIGSGWMAEGGFVSPGATQTITTGKGEPVLSTPDLFTAVPRVAAAKAGYLRLKAVITQTEKNQQAFLVRFRIWDKTGPGEISGSYRLLVSRNAEDE
jgi:hypothetical protein